MKSIKIHWKDKFDFIAKNNINAYNRMSLCYPVAEFDKGIEMNPFTLFDHQRNHGGKLGYQKEGIQISTEGNPNGMSFDVEELFIPIQ